VPAPSISISEPAPGAGIAEYLGTVSGTVRNLRPGQTVWVFNDVANYPYSVYLNTGPCAVSGTNWTCGYIYVGPASDNTQTFAIWAAVVSSQQSAYLGHSEASQQWTVHYPEDPPSADVAHYQVLVHRCGPPTSKSCS
jgi:hypothetical protein